MIDREEEIPHQWRKGEFVRKLGDRYLSRDDECELCGCIRHYIKVFRKGKKPRIILVGYTRSKGFFSEDNMPQCWGAKNPQ